MCFDGMINQRFDPLDELDRMRQSDMCLERRFIFPTRVNVEKLRIADRAKRMNTQAADFLSRRIHDLMKRLFNGCFGSGPSMKTCEDKEFHMAHYYIRSTTIAIPCPTPIHILHNA